MEEVTNPRVRLMASGDKLEAKEMRASGGDLLPEHIANLESILFVQEGEIIFYMKGEEQVLSSGDCIIVPPKIRHQIRAKTEFKAVHFMPKEIKFQFF